MWGSYSQSDASKLKEEIAEEVYEGEMPLRSYLPMHSDANLDAAQRQLIADWFAPDKDFNEHSDDDDDAAREDKED